jgi:hypothetical protein
MSISKKEKKAILNKIYKNFFNCFSPIIIKELNETNHYWRTGFCLSFFREQNSSYTSIKLMSPNMLNCFNAFKKSITKQDLEVFISDRSLNKIPDSNYYNSRDQKKLERSNVIINDNKIVYQDDNIHQPYAIKSLVYLLIYMFKQDRRLLNFTFEKGCDKFVRSILEHHSQFLSTKVMLEKLNVVTTDPVRKSILFKIMSNSGSKPIVKWVNSNGGLASMTSGLRNHILYDLQIKPHEFTLITKLDNTSEEGYLFLENLKVISKKINSSFANMIKNIGKSDKVYNNTILEVFQNMSEFNNQISKLSSFSEAEKVILKSSVLHFLESSKDFQITKFKPDTLIESILYLPKVFSMFYIAEYDTINSFFRNIHEVQGHRYYNLRVDENQFGNLIINSNAKLF